MPTELERIRNEWKEKLPFPDLPPLILKRLQGSRLILETEVPEDYDARVGVPVRVGCIDPDSGRITTAYIFKRWEYQDNPLAIGRYEVVVFDRYIPIEREDFEYDSIDYMHPLSRDRYKVEEVTIKVWQLDTLGRRIGRDGCSKRFYWPDKELGVVLEERNYEPIGEEDGSVRIPTRWIEMTRSYFFNNGTVYYERNSDPSSGLWGLMVHKRANVNKGATLLMVKSIGVTVNPKFMMPYDLGLADYVMF